MASTTCFDEDNLSKEECFTTLTDNGKEVYKCNICNKVLSRRQRILTHLNTVHKKSPLKRVYKRYISDQSLSKPKRTVFRHKSKLAGQIKTTATTTNISKTVSKGGATEVQVTAPMMSVDDRQEILFDASNDSENSVHATVIYSKESDVQIINKEDDMACETISFQEAECPSSGQHDYTTDNSSVVLDDSDVALDEDENSFTSADSDRSGVTSDDDDDDTCNPHTQGDIQSSTQQFVPSTENINKLLSPQETSALCIMSYLLKYNVGGCQAKALMELLSVLCPSSEHFKNNDMTNVLTFEDEDTKSKHYCSLCTRVFPDDEDVFQCTTEGCTGYRYIGSLSNQRKSGRQARSAFLLANTRHQLKFLLEREGIWSTIDYAKNQQDRKREESDICDVMDGEHYKRLSSAGNFLSESHSISMIFNTDGIPLYQSSKVKLWPIFLAINELPAAQRFSRENMLLAGIWQGKGNPPFDQYMYAFGEEMSILKDEGVQVHLSNASEPFCVKALLILGTMDLQAKAYVLNMTMHNGKYGCITCEEEGITVAQGRGYSRYYPRRSERASIRDSDDIKYDKGPRATRNERLKGICGLSGLSTMTWFDVVHGTVPDYMHGVLLGVTKGLMYKWFSPTNNKMGYFIGNKIKLISSRLQVICPPDYIERLPRDLETNYTHFKATELQSWLLFYAIPCLHGVLVNKYLEHFALLSEAIHLLLGDRITRREIQKAESMLETFYSQFAELYGEGSCGLNVHNIGVHLVDYVKQWGPLWGWSCFPFEDMNAEILKSVHGTGDVTHQYLRIKEAKIKLASVSIDSLEHQNVKDFFTKMKSASKKGWTGLKKMRNCYIAGRPTALTQTNVDFAKEIMLLTETKTKNLAQLQKASRVQVNGTKLYSREYERMSKRICYVVRSSKGDILDIHFFVVSKDTKDVFCVAKKLTLKENCFLFERCGHHLMQVAHTSDVVILPIHIIVEKVFFIQVEEDSFVALMPNILGHSIFK